MHEVIVGVRAPRMPRVRGKRLGIFERRPARNLVLDQEHVAAERGGSSPSVLIRRSGGLPVSGSRARPARRIRSQHDDLALEVRHQEEPDHERVKFAELCTVDARKPSCSSLQIEILCPSTTPAS